MSKEVLSKAKLLNFYEQIPRKIISRNLSLISKHAFSRVDTLKNLLERILSEVSFAGRQSALKQKKKAHEQILPFVATYHPGVKNLKNTLMYKYSLIENQPLLRTIFKKPPII